MSKDNKDLKKLAEQLVNLSVLELNDLNQILKDEHGVEPMAASVVAPAAASSDGDGEKSQAAEKDKYDIVLKDAGDQKILIIKAIKDLTEMPLGEAKALVESAPKNIKEAVPKEEAQEIKAKLEEAGATIELS